MSTVRRTPDRTPIVFAYGHGVLRTALQPRWLALLALVLVVCVAFGWLGSWQLGVARDKGARQAAREVTALPPAPLDDVLVAQQPFPTPADGRAGRGDGHVRPRAAGAGRRTAAARTLRAGGSWRRCGRRPGPGCRSSAGWVPSPDDDAADPAHAPSGVVEVTGVLQPDDAPADGAAAAADRAARPRWTPPSWSTGGAHRSTTATWWPPPSGRRAPARQPERVTPPKPQPQRHRPGATRRTPSSGGSSPASRSCSGGRWSARTSANGRASRA